MNTRVTIKDVAKQTGLSVGTISNYINGKPVSQKNRELIAASIDELGFRVNKFARSLRTSSSKTVAVLTSDFNTVYISSIIAAMEKLLMEKGYGMLVSHYSYSIASLKERLCYLLDENADGFVFMPRIEMDAAAVMHLKEFNTIGTPVVLVNGTIQGVEADSVSVDYEKAVYDACNEFFKKGHQKIALLITSRKYNYSNRIVGYKKAYKDIGLPLDESLICISEMGKQHGYETVRRILKERPDVKAILASGYKYTLGAMRAISEAGLTVGKDISIIGFDSEDICDIYPQRLSYVDIAISETASRIVSLLLRRISGDEENYPENVLATPQFIEGQSVAELK